MTDEDNIYPLEACRHRQLRVDLFHIRLHVDVFDSAVLALRVFGEPNQKAVNSTGRKTPSEKRCGYSQTPLLKTASSFACLMVRCPTGIKQFFS